jgi:UDP-2-acetamido-3-amino-2,3-dideoxy-glucuronate N-acetyltransferase
MIRITEIPGVIIHETAWVDSPCEVGEGTRIWHFSHVQTGAIIGKNCVLGQNVNIGDDVVVGDNVRIQNNVSVYTGVELENDVFLGPSCVFTNISNPRSQVNRKSVYERTLVKKGASVGANSTIVCGVTLGRYSFVGAGAVVTKDLPDYALVVGAPARQMGWMSRHGHPLKNPDKEGIMTCPESNLRYKLLNEYELICIDLDEDEPLPAEISKSDKPYRDWNNNPGK